jgi:hypothetical protein
MIAPSQSPSNAAVPRDQIVLNKILSKELSGENRQQVKTPVQNQSNQVPLHFFHNRNQMVFEQDRLAEALKKQMKEAEQYDTNDEADARCDVNTEYLMPAIRRESAVEDFQLEEEKSPFENKLIVNDQPHFKIGKGNIIKNQMFKQSSHGAGKNTPMK